MRKYKIWIIALLLLAPTLAWGITAREVVQQYREEGLFNLSTVPELMRGEVNVFFVDNESATASDVADGTHGESLKYPFKTLDFAIGQCAASKGDVIIVAPRSTEAKAASGILNTVDVIGISIVGLGEGANKPTIALSGNTGAIAFSVTAAGVTIRNFLITNAVNATVKAINVAEADCTLQDIEIRDGASTTECQVGVLTTAAAVRLRIDKFYYNGFVTGDATTAAIALNGVVDAKITNSRFRGTFIAGSYAIDMRTVLSTGIVVDNCIFENGTQALTRDVGDTIGSSVWSATNCFDVVGGYSFAGGSGTALASYAPAASAAALSTNNLDHLMKTVVADDTGAIDLTEVVDKTVLSWILSHDGDTATFVPSTMALSKIASYSLAAQTAAEKIDTNTELRTLLVGSDVALPTGAAVTAVGAQVTNLAYSEPVTVFTTADEVTSNLFTVAGGPIEILRFWGYVDVLIGANATTCKIGIDATAGASYDRDFTTAVAIETDAVGTLYVFTAANPAVLTPLTPGANGASNLMNGASWFCEPGTVIGTMSADPGGAGGDHITWYMTYRPLKTGVTVAGVSP